MTAAQPQRPTDPRIERSRMLILKAAVDQLAEAGYGGFSVEAVAARAGVAKSTLYRHWPDKLALITDAFGSFHEHMSPDITDASPRERVQRLVRHVAEVLLDSTFSRCIPALIEAAQRDPQLREFHHHYSTRRRQELVEVIAHGVAAGDLPGHVDPELAALALLGPLFYQRLMSAEAFPPDRTNDLVTAVLGAPPRRPRRDPGRARSPRQDQAGSR
jgi:TetR/AcrR family transcriptional regulator of autoinduction and epiphytic fitness